MPTSLPQFKQALKRTIADNLGQCIKQLEAALDPNRSIYNDCLGLLSNFNRLERDNLSNILAWEDFNQGISKLNMAVLNLIDSLVEDDLSEVRHLREEIHQHILVVCTIQRQQYMERFFSKNFFRNIRYINYGDLIPSERFDLAVLDNIESDPAAALYLETYCEGLSCYLLFFGEVFPLDKTKYANKAYFANSIFSLYARIREMLDFIKYYGSD